MLYELQKFHQLSTENNVAQTHYGFSVLFPSVEVKSESKYSSKYLRFLSMVRIEMKVS